MAIPVARSGTELTLATDAEIHEIGTTTYALTFRMGGKLVTGTFDRGSDTPLNAYHLGSSTYDITYRVGPLGLDAVSITIGMNNGPYLLR